MVNAQGRLPYLQYQSKPSINNETHLDWFALKDIAHNISSINSNDGKYIGYRYGSDKKSSIMIRSVSGDYHKEFVEPVQFGFTNDNKRFIVLTQENNLEIYNLSTKKKIDFSDVELFKLPKNGIGKWLVFNYHNIKREIVLLNLYTNQTFVYPHVENYFLDESEKMIFIQGRDKISVVDLNRGKENLIHPNGIISKITLDNENLQLAYISNNNKGDSAKILVYNAKTNLVKMIANDNSPQVPNDMAIDNGLLRFSENGTKVFFQLKKRNNNKHESSKTTNAIELYNSRNKFLEARPSYGEDSIIYAVSDIRKPRIIKLTDFTTEIKGGGLDPFPNNFILTKDRTISDEFFWSGEIMSLNLVSLNNGESRLIKQTSNNLNENNPFLSPNENFVVWFDSNSNIYYSYNTKTGEIINLSKSIPYPLYDDKNVFLNRRNAYSTAGWLENDKALLIYDAFDIWQVDPLGLTKPINLTKGYGRKNHTVLRRVDNKFIDQITSKSILLTAFNIDNKRNGFGTLVLNDSLILNESHLGDYVYSGNISPGTSSMAFNYLPQKLNDTTYLVRRMSATESPNLFLTNDFIKYRPITNIHPEKKYNWMSTELIHWKLINGETAEGILYLPENFDPNKKYPLIYHYYEKRSDELNVFRQPELSSGDISIPWFVSNGYLVFIPNMYYEIGNNKNAIIKNILVSVDTLKKRRWVDYNHMGLQGHSYGGYETLTIIEQTNIFKAAQESAGIGNWISIHGHVFAGRSRQLFCEFDQPGLGSTPWDNPEIYIRNSPIFYVQNIYTPLFILHNREDNNVPFSQGLELFTALRRLKKEAWLLSYNREYHTISKEENQLDFTIRQQEFFDHYLKDHPTPNWMNQK